jgi:phage-related protein
MEFWIIVDRITALMVMILSIVAVIATIFMIVLCAKGNRLMKTINDTAQSVQEFTQVPMQVVSALIQKFMG